MSPMNRKDFVRTMAAAGALPGFLGEKARAESPHVAVSKKLAIFEGSPLIVSGISWYAPDGSGSGAKDFLGPAGGPIHGSDFWVNVDITKGDGPWDSTSKVSLMRGQTTIYQEIVRGEVEAVFVHTRDQGPLIPGDSR